MNHDFINVTGYIYISSHVFNVMLMWNCLYYYYLIINQINIFNLIIVNVPTREMRPRELLKSSSPSFGRVRWLGDELWFFLSSCFSFGEHRMVGYLRRHSDAQVSKAGDQLSGRWIVINDISYSLRCVLFILF